MSKKIAITDKNKIKNGMTFYTTDKKHYIRIREYAVPCNPEKKIRLDEIEEKDITAIYKLNGKLMYEENKEE